MIEPFRSDFNARFTQEKYAEFVDRAKRETKTDIEFRMAETPCFFTAETLQRMADAGVELTQQLLDNEPYLALSRQAIPAEYDVPGQGAHPHFMTVDFGFVRDAVGELQPKLVEMQAFPSIFGFQSTISRLYKEVFELDPSLEFYLSGLDEAGYWAVLREVIVGNHDPANVVLLEIDPEHQKTLPDFRVHEQHLGVRTVDISSVIKHGDRLFYRDSTQGGRLTRIERIYNRAIVDELVRREIALPFDYRDPLDVEWAGHPNWYFQISKFSIPYLRHPTVPAAVFVDEWVAGQRRDELPADPQQWVLKPLYSFAGKGIQFAPTEEEILAIPARDRHNYLLQERVSFEPVIRTPEGPTQAEVRILYVWAEGKDMLPVMSLVRMGRGLMMGVDHNRDRTWVGASAGLYIPERSNGHKGF